MNTGFVRWNVVQYFETFFSGVLQQHMLKLFVMLLCFICGSLNVHVISSSISLTFLDFGSLKVLPSKLMKVHCKFVETY